MNHDPQSPQPSGPQPAAAPPGPHPHASDPLWKECYLSALNAAVNGWGEGVAVEEVVEAAIEVADASIARIRGRVTHRRTVPGDERPVAERPGSDQIGNIKIHTTR